MLSLRDRIKAAPQVAKEVVRINEWDIDIEVRGITLGQRSRIMRDGYTKGEDPTPVYEVFYPLLLAFACYNPVDGTAIWTETPEDAAFINALNPAPVDTLARVAMKLSGLSSKEGAEKNAGGSSPSASSSSSSPSS
jgi:hypothetical protein